MELLEETVRRIEFGADGIRAIAYKWPLTPEAVRRIGGALGQFVRSESENGTAAPRVVLGRDTRPSGKELADNLKEGLLGQGVHVMDLGVMTTPGVAYLTRHQKAALGLVVSASHNPPDHNGIKLIGPDGLRLREENEIEDLINESVAGAVKPNTERGSETDAGSWREDYIQAQVKLCPFESLAGLKLVLDCANGALSKIAPQTFERLGAQIFAVNNHSNGHAINERCGSEHARQHPQDLAAIVRGHGAACGFAFDGDGDRLVIVDRGGCIYNGDDILFVLATFFHAQGRLSGDTIVTTRMANMGLEEALRGDPWRIGVRYTERGDKNLEADIWKNSYLLGAEQVGNVIINDGHHTAADSLYAALLLGGIVHDYGPLLELVVPLRKRPQVLASVKLTSQPLLPEQQLEALRQEALSKGTRVLMWHSSTECGLFKIMVEGSHHHTWQEVRNQAVAICQSVQRVTGSETQEPTVLDLSTRKRTSPSLVPYR